MRNDSGEHYTMRYHFPPGQEKQAGDRRPTALEVVASLAPVVLAIFAQLQGQQERFWGLMALAFLSVSLVVYRPVSAWLRRQSHKRHNERMARREFPRLKQFAVRFAELIDPNRDDTLSSLWRGGGANFNIPSSHWFGSLVSHLSTRLDTDQGDFTHLTLALDEFHTLLSAYADQCLSPIFQNLTPDAKATLSPELRSGLESFRERYVKFRDDYEEYTKEIVRSVKGIMLQPLYLFRPKPIAA
jgi:hypothetical protein